MWRRGPRLWPALPEQSSRRGLLSLPSLGLGFSDCSFLSSRVPLHFLVTLSSFSARRSNACSACDVLHQGYVSRLRGLIPPGMSGTPPRPSPPPPAPAYGSTSAPHPGSRSTRTPPPPASARPRLPRHPAVEFPPAPPFPAVGPAPPSSSGSPRTVAVPASG